MAKIPDTNENLKKHATKPLMQWLIDAAKRRRSITYGEAKRRLEAEIGFSDIFPTRMGIPAGALMSDIQNKWPEKKKKWPEKCPLLNILLVQQSTLLPGDGAGPFMARYLNDRDLKSDGFRQKYPKRWRDACEKIATDVYAFEDWDQVYHHTFDEHLPTLKSPKGEDRDGIRHNRKGEGVNHRNLRMWVKNNPGKIKKSYKNFRSDTEVVLDSADRVDVVYYDRNMTVAIEVKSCDSNDEDLRRGIFQCIKYRAVMKAMDIRLEPKVDALLVTQKDLPGTLESLLRRNEIRHFKAPRRIATK